MKHPQTGIDRILENVECLIGATAPFTVLEMAQAITNLKESKSHAEPPRRHNNSFIDEVKKPNQ
jgi:hypothetical protein